MERYYLSYLMATHFTPSLVPIVPRLTGSRSTSFRSHDLTEIIWFGLTVLTKIFPGVWLFFKKRIYFAWLRRYFALSNFSLSVAVVSVSINLHPGPPIIAEIGIFLYTSSRMPSLFLSTARRANPISAPI